MPPRCGAGGRFGPHGGLRVPRARPPRGSVSRHPRSLPVRFANQLWAFVRRDYLLASSSKLTFAWQLITVLFAAPTMYYLGRLIQPAAVADLRPYGGDYF